MNWIADIGSNHNQDLERAIQLVSKAKEIGCTGVKFQLFEADKLYDAEFTEKITKFKECELPRNFIPEIKEHCETIGLSFGCTPFHVEDIAFLKDYVDFFKIGSYEALYKPLLVEVLNTNLPVVISLGMLTKKEFVENITKTIFSTRGSIEDITLLHCVSSYPAIPQRANLDALKVLKESTHFNIGYSDHTRHPGVIYAASALGAKTIEFHLDSGGCGQEYLHGHCWLPEQIKEVIENIAIGELAKEPTVIMPDHGNRDERMDPSDGKRPMKIIRKSSYATE